jgi:hypothetical protein
MNLRRLHQMRHILHANIREAEVLERRDAFISWNIDLVVLAAVEIVDAQKSRAHSGDVQIVCRYVLNKSAAPWPRLDIDRVRMCAVELAVLDAHVAHASRNLAADANAGKIVVDERAI